MLKDKVLKMLENVDTIKDNFTATVHANSARNIAGTVINYLS